MLAKQYNELMAHRDTLSRQLEAMKATASATALAAAATAITSGSSSSSVGSVVLPPLQHGRQSTGGGRTAGGGGAPARGYSQSIGGLAVAGGPSELHISGVGISERPGKQHHQQPHQHNHHHQQQAQAQLQHPQPRRSRMSIDDLMLQVGGGVVDAAAVVSRRATGEEPGGGCGGEGGALSLLGVKGKGSVVEAGRRVAAMMTRIGEDSSGM